MINTGNTVNYEILKSSFKEGIKFKMTPFEYAKGNIVNSTINNDYLANVVKGLYIEPNSIKMLITRTFPAQTDWDMTADKVTVTSYIEKLAKDGNHKISDSFCCGMQNPSVCFMAWYDAITEHLLEKANSLLGVKAPIPCINSELNKLQKGLLKDTEYADVKARLYDALKKSHPKTYKKRCELLEKNYNKKIQNGITKIVEKLIHG